MNELKICLIRVWFKTAFSYFYKEADWWNSDDAAGLLESLFDTLDSYSPEGYYFGAHLGDGSDYGFWKMDK